MTIDDAIKNLKCYLTDLASQGKPGDFDIHIRSNGTVDIRSNHWKRLKSWRDREKKIRKLKRKWTHDAIRQE